MIAYVQISVGEDIKYQSRSPRPDQIFEVSARQFERRVRYPTADQLNTLTTAWTVGPREPAPARSWADSPHADDIHIVNEIHTWKGAQMGVYLKTRDVIHSFYLPHLRLKQDALPGKTIPVWFQATEANTIFEDSSQHWVDGIDVGNVGGTGFVWIDLRLSCAVGAITKMIGRLYVHADRDDYIKWLTWAQKEQNRSQPPVRAAGLAPALQPPDAIADTAENQPRRSLNLLLIQCAVKTNSRMITMTIKIRKKIRIRIMITIRIKPYHVLS